MNVLNILYLLFHRFISSLFQVIKFAFTFSFTFALFQLFSGYENLPLFSWSIEDEMNVPENERRTVLMRQLGACVAGTHGKPAPKRSKHGWCVWEAEKKFPFD
jgi:hypothetical protein